MLKDFGGVKSVSGVMSISALAQKMPQPPYQAPAESILESISDGVFTVDENFRITFFNAAAEQITGVSRAMAMGKPCHEVFRSDMCASHCALKETLTTGAPVINKSAHILNDKGNEVPISLSTALLRNHAGETIGGAETFRDLTLVETLVRELEGRCQLGDLVTKSPLMRKIFDVLPQIATSDSTVLIQGETGTGKELLARAIHSMSNRNSMPLISLNCGALPDTLLESELFGYKAGAFTGANKDKLGRFALAEGGTLFLDEIGEISPALQVRLLRVLQEKSYEPLGGVHSVKANVRVICATNRSLADLVQEGKFRQDLFFRINVVRVEPPPLRSRKEDIPLLVDHFIKRFNRLQGKRVRGITQETMAVLMAHDFPGNCRELENLVEHAFVLCSEGYITPACLPEEFSARHRSWQPPPAYQETSEMEKVLHGAEAEAIIAAIRRNNNNRVAAARELGIHKSTLFRKIKQLGIALPEFDGRYRNA